MGDGVSIIRLKETVSLPISMLNEYGEPTDPIFTEFFISETLGEEAIIGLPDLLGNYFVYFKTILDKARREYLSSTGRIWTELNVICDRFEQEMHKPSPSRKAIKKMVRDAQNNLVTYSRNKALVKADPNMSTVKHEMRSPYDLVDGPDDDDSVVFLVSQKHGIAFDDDRIENIVAAIEVCAETRGPMPGELLQPWSEPPEYCQEEQDTPDPLAMGEDVIHFMEMSPRKSLKKSILI